MAKQKTVVDASIMVKWFVEEVGTDRALAFLDGHEKGEILLVVPDIAFSEVLNALRFTKGKEQNLLKANNMLWKTEMEIERTTSPILEKACRFARTHNLSVYDAIYYAIAVLHSAPLITEDKKLLALPQAQPL